MVRRGLPLLLLLCGCDVVFGLERPAEPPPVPGEWVTVTTGGIHSCGIQSDHTLWCWGDNVYGEAGLGVGLDTIEILAPRQVGEDAWLAVSAGGSHTCGLHEDRTLWCWGNNSGGQLGDASHEQRTEPVQIGTDQWRAVGAGEYSTCGIREDGSLWCWGANTLGQIGDGTRSERVTPTLIDSAHDWRTISTGLGFACAITGGELWCWGTFASSAGPFSLSAVRVHAAVGWTQIAVGAGFACGVTDDGGVRCFGDDNAFGQLGDKTMTAHSTAEPIALARTDWVSVATRNHTACALAFDGTFACWGENRRGQIGSDTALPLQPEPHVIGGTWIVSAPGSLHSCAIDTTRHLWCTGSNALGGRGDGAGGGQLEPQKLEGTWSVIETGDAHTCGLRGGSLMCFGENGSGQLGEGTTIARQVPVQAQMPQPSANLGVGQSHTCDLDIGGRIWCWGDNHDGQLGPEATTLANVTTPTAIAASGGANGLVAHSFNCAYVRGGVVSCWGRNTEGQLGRNSTAAFSPNFGGIVNVSGTALQFLQISAGLQHGCGITAGDNQVYCWGSNNQGQLGTPTFTSKPYALATGLFAKQVTTGSTHTCAITLSDKLFCWGSNTFGQIGDGGATVTSPLQIGTATWLAVSAGAAHTCAIQTDRSLWCWGSNGRGSLGDGTRASHPAPTKIGSAAWLAVSAGSGYTCGIQMDGSAWCWGNRLWGQLGDNKSWNTKFVPVEVAE